MQVLHPTALQLFVSFGLLSNSLSCSSIHSHLTSILNLHFSQIRSDIILLTLISYYQTLLLVSTLLYYVFTVLYFNLVWFCVQTQFMLYETTDYHKMFLARNNRNCISKDRYSLYFDSQAIQYLK
jgi:hypothetical protein